MIQQMAATGKSPKRFHAATMPATRASMPGSGEVVVRIMSGNVITASVT
jgi:hypothetical protein